MGRTKKSKLEEVIEEIFEESEDQPEDKKDSPEEIRKRIQKEIEKNFGKGIIVKGTEIIERPKTIIPVSPAIDRIINGGIPEGSWVILSGKEKCGKTTTALHFAKNCQKTDYGDRTVYFLNVEGRLKRRDILGIPGIKSDKIEVIESTEDKILSTQEYLNIASKILLTEKKCVLIIDSISQLADDREMTGGIGTQTRGSGGIWIGQFTSQMSNVVPVKNSIVISILHLRNNTSGYGAGTFEKGGKAIQYQVDVKLMAEGIPAPWALIKDGEPFGQIVTWKCHSSALGPPGRKCESYIRYGEGIDEIQESIIDAREMGLITGDAYYYLVFLKNHLEEIGHKDKLDREFGKDDYVEIGARAHGQHELRKILVNNPQWLELLKKDIKELM
jgi:RecA/RadA recombinase